jgi:hypothetical protein
MAGPWQDYMARAWQEHQHTHTHAHTHTHPRTHARTLARTHAHTHTNKNIGSWRTPQIHTHPGDTPHRLHRKITGPRPTWVISNSLTDLEDEYNQDDYYLNFFEDHDYSGTWPQWLDSLLMPDKTMARAWQEHGKSMPRNKNIGMWLLPYVRPRYTSLFTGRPQHLALAASQGSASLRAGNGWLELRWRT